MFARKPIPAAPASQSRTDAGPYASAVADFARAAAAGMARRRDDEDEPVARSHALMDEADADRQESAKLVALRERARLATELADEAERDLMEAELEAERLDAIEAGDLDRNGDPIAWPTYRSV